MGKKTPDCEAAIRIRHVPEELRRQVKAAAALRGQTMEQLILEAVTAYLKESRR